MDANKVATKCVGERCWYNPETGYIEYCEKHEAEIADKAMELEAQRRGDAATRMGKVGR